MKKLGRQKTMKAYKKPSLFGLQLDPSNIFVFSDNVDIQIFQKMSLEIKSRLYYEPQTLEDAFLLKIPRFVNENYQSVLSPENKVYQNGFWSRIDFKGSQMPTCRENSTMVITQAGTQQRITLFGGANPKLGITNFEAFTMLLDKRHWEKISIQKNILEQKGTRPVIGLSNDHNIEAYTFSGQQPFERMNGGVKICTTDLHKV